MEDYDDGGGAALAAMIYGVGVVIYIPEDSE